MDSCLKPIYKTEKELWNANLATQINYHYAERMSLTLVHSEVTKYSNYKQYFISSFLSIFLKPIHHLFNEMGIMQSPIRWKTEAVFNIRLKKI